MGATTFYGAMRLHEPERWRAEVSSVLNEYGDNRVKAARKLGVSLRTLRTWARELGYDRLQPKSTGRPPKKRDALLRGSS